MYSITGCSGAQLNAKEDGIAVDVATDAAKAADRAWHDVF
jgi:hypothetical protein